MDPTLLNEAETEIHDTSKNRFRRKLGDVKYRLLLQKVLLLKTCLGAVTAG
jgi:hypothetical protein